MLELEVTVNNIYNFVESDWNLVDYQELNIVLVTETNQYKSLCVESYLLANAKS